MHRPLRLWSERRPAPRGSAAGPGGTALPGTRATRPVCATTDGAPACRCCGIHSRCVSFPNLQMEMPRARAPGINTITDNTERV